jgi:hypothetical protein
MVQRGFKNEIIAVDKNKHDLKMQIAKVGLGIKKFNQWANDIKCSSK